MIVRWTTRAAKDLESICDYTEDRFGTEQAHQAALGIYGAADSLVKMPLRGRIGRRSGTRELSVPQLLFVLIYRVAQDVVEILRMLHGARQWP